MSGTQRQQNHPLAGAEDTLKDFWTSRPRRPRRGRKIAGVAAAIANRYQIDPVLVRVLLVVSAVIGGAGLMIYLAGWLFFPDENDEEAPLPALIGRGRSRTGWFFTLFLCAVLFGASLYTFNGDGGEGIVGLALLLAGLFLLHRGRASMAPQTPLPVPQQPVAQPTMPLGMDMNAPTSEQPAPPQPEQRTSPPAWDPLGAAPFAWDLPDPAPSQPEPQPPAPRRKRSAVGGITLGTALAVGGALALVAPQVSWLTTGHIIGIVLAIVGLGMVGGSLMGGGRGLIGLAVPLALVGFVFSTTSTGSGPWVDAGAQDWGNISAKPTMLTSVQPYYSVGGGNIDLDLTGLPNTGEVHTSLNAGLGTVSVLVPANADVQVTCDAGLGSVDCLGYKQNATDAHVSTVDNGTDSVGGLKIYLDARVNSGTVEVRRG